MSDSRALLMKKLLAICPVCKKPIYGKDIDVNNIDITKINHWPVKYTPCHSHNGTPVHALTMYIDSNFSVRGKEVSEFLKIQRK
ncbi:MAG: hypothetical protein BAJALOKI3v1_210018 [Promethearchaeota archaeon]|nr:MAG: hypothetical protein BAJALOKI3v1_210018 [Candidatus Lokiarchaeota archaeon]